MTRNRIIISLIAVLMLVPIGYFGINSVNPLKAAESGVFSRDRVLADKYLDDKNWVQANYHLTNILAQDPLNGYAWNSYVYSLKVMRNEFKTELKESQLDADSRAKLEGQIAKLEQDLVQPLKKQATFLRFRSRALIDLAALSTLRKDWDLALDYVEDYVNGNPLRDAGLADLVGLGNGGRSMIDIDEQDLKDNYPEVEPNKVGLHRFARFWELVDKEAKIRAEKGYLRFSPFFGE